MQISAASTVSPFLTAKPPISVRHDKIEVASNRAPASVPAIKQVSMATPGTSPLQNSGLGALQRMAVLSRGDVSSQVSSGSFHARERVEQARYQQTSAPQPDAEVTLDGLLKAWGTNEAMYDLNGDGTVDVLDLLQFLGSQAEQ